MAKKFHDRLIGHSLPISRDDMLKRVARFGEQVPDRAAFPDLDDPARKREVVYMVSPGETAGPATISQPHNFHMALLTMRPGVRPATHAHPYNEVFMALDATCRFHWGETLEDWVDLDPFDVISIPAGVFRTFEVLGPREGHVMAIFDTAGDPHANVTVSAEMYEKYYRQAKEEHEAAAKSTGIP